MMRIRTLLDRHNSVEAADVLEHHLSGPLRTIGPGESRSPEFDLIDENAEERFSGSQRETLALSFIVLLRRCMSRLVDRFQVETAIKLAGRIGFVCSTIDLRLEGETLFGVALYGKLASDIGVPIDIDDYFLVLRGVGRMDLLRPTLPDRRHFWESLLKVKDEGIRTLAAQNIVRFDPFDAIGRMDVFFDAGVHEPILAHEFLQRIGDAAELARIANVLLPSPTLTRLASALREVGEEKAADAIADWKASPGEGIVADQARGVQKADVIWVVARQSSRTRLVRIEGLNTKAYLSTVNRFMSTGALETPTSFDPLDERTLLYPCLAH